MVLCLVGDPNFLTYVFTVCLFMTFARKLSFGLPLRDFVPAHIKTIVSFRACKNSSVSVALEDADTKKSLRVLY